MANDFIWREDEQSILDQIMAAASPLDKQIAKEYFLVYLDKLEELFEVEDWDEAEYVAAFLEELASSIPSKHYYDYGGKLRLNKLNEHLTLKAKDSYRLAYLMSVAEDKGLENIYIYLRNAILLLSQAYIVNKASRTFYGHVDVDALSDANALLLEKAFPKYHAKYKTVFLTYGRTWIEKSLRDRKAKFSHTVAIPTEGLLHLGKQDDQASQYDVRHVSIDAPIQEDTTLSEIITDDEDIEDVLEKQRQENKRKFVYQHLPEGVWNFIKDIVDIPIEERYPIQDEEIEQYFDTTRTLLELLNKNSVQAVVFVEEKRRALEKIKNFGKE